MENQKGIISLFVLFAMLFLLVFCLSAYLGIRNKLQMQEYKTIEMQEIYSKSIDINKSSEFAKSNELIPIYNSNQLDVVGTGSYLKINNKIYECGRGMSYILKNDIIIDIDEDLKYKKIGFNDYKMYSSTYYIDKQSYGIYYYKDGYYWKNIAYQKFDKDNKNFSIENGTYLPNEFSILGKYNFANLKPYTFLVVWNDEEGNLSNFEIGTQNIINLMNLNQIDVLNKCYKNIDKTKGEFYVFLNIGNNI